MMANLTIKQVEDYVGKDVAEKIQNEEGKVWEGGSVKQGKLTGQQLSVGGKGMKGFYGEPSEGKEGIVGGVAKAQTEAQTESKTEAQTESPTESPTEAHWFSHSICSGVTSFTSGNSNGFTIGLIINGSTIRLKSRPRTHSSACSRSSIGLLI